MWILSGLLLACSEYNIGTEPTKNNGLDEGDTAGIDDTDTASVVNEDTANQNPDSSITETGDSTSTEPSTEPVEGGLSEPELETDVGYDPNAGLISNLGNVVTILMALSDQWIPEATAKQLLINSVAFATEIANPRILVIRD